MSRILKRPMFRSGGSTNEGIMHGLVDRKGYAEGPTQSEIYAKEFYDQISAIQPPKPRFNMGQMGLNLVSGKYAGEGLLQNIAGSAKGPYSQWTKADDASRNLDYQTQIAAAKYGISKADAEALVKAKAKKGMYIVLSPEEAKKELKEAYNPKVAYQRDLSDNKIQPIGGSPSTVINLADKVKKQIKATKEEKELLGFQEGDDVILTKDVMGNIVGSKLTSSVDQRMQVIGKAVKDTNLQDADDALRNLENYIVFLKKKGFDNLPGIGTFGGLVPGVVATKEAIKLRALVAAYENITLKKRSGAAVTPSELARVQNELAGAVKTSDESVFLEILKLNRKILEGQKTATFAIHRKSDVEAYWESGGLSLYETPLSEKSTEELLEDLKKLN